MAEPWWFFYAGQAWQLSLQGDERRWLVQAPGHELMWPSTEQRTAFRGLPTTPVEQAKVHIDSAGCTTRTCHCHRRLVIDF